MLSDHEKCALNTVNCNMLNVRLSAFFSTVMISHLLLSYLARQTWNVYLNETKSLALASCLNVNGKLNSLTHNYISFYSAFSTRQRHPFSLVLFQSKNKACRYSLFPRTVVDWNHLDIHIVMEDDIDQFQTFRSVAPLLFCISESLHLCCFTS